MHGLFAAAALVATAFAAPAAPAGKETFTINQVAVKNGVIRSGAQSMVRTYAKFGKEAPANVKAAAAAQQSGSATATPQNNDEEYLVPVTVGADTLNLDFDTGSSDLWVFSTVTPASESSGKTLYNPSTGTKKSGYSWKISYGDGSGAAGTVYGDKVAVGPVTATSQAVEAATSVSSQFESSPGDGLLGLAFSSINTVTPTKQNTFFDTVGSTLAQYLFTADLKHNAPGSYTFGYIPNSYTGSISYVPVDDSQGFWGFTAGAYSFGSGSGSGSNSTGSIGAAIADTGTTLLYLPSNVVSAYYATVKGASNNAQQGGYVLPCSGSTPAFNVVIGGATFTVPGDYIAYAPISSGSATCFGGIQANTGIGLNIFGDIFLKSVLAVFDKTQSAPRIGFAAKTTT